MDLRAADIVLVPLEVAGAIDLFTSEAEPVEPPAHDPPDPVSLFVAKPETFDDVLAGEATDLTGVPVLGHPAWSGRGRSSVIGPFLRRGAARFRQLTLFAIRLPVRGAALVGTHVARAAHSVSASAGPIASSGRRSLMAAGHSLRLAGARGRVWLVAARHSLQQAASSGRARVLRDADTAALQVRHAVTRGSDRARRAFHELQGGAVLLQAYGRALGPPLRRGRARVRVHVSELAGRSDNLSVALRPYLRGLRATIPQPVQQALQRFDGSLLFGRHTLVIRTCLSASMVGVSIAMLFVISATPKPRSAQAVALRPAIEPVADLASADQERAAITAVLDQYRRFYNALDATSVSTIWRGLDLQALQRSFSALARQNLSFRKCEVNLASSDRARAMCTGVLSFVRRAGSEVEQRRNLSLTIELRQLDDRWQIVDVAAR